MEHSKEIYKIEEALNEQGFIITKVKGISMLPLLDENKDLIKLEKVNGLLDVYDMALFKRGDKLVLHRILEIRDGYYNICGDNQISMEKVPYENVIGKVVGYFKSGRYVSLTDIEYQEYLNNLEKDLTKRKKYFHYADVPAEYLDLLDLIRAVINDEEFKREIDYKKVFDLAYIQYIAAYIFPKIDSKLCPEKIYKNWENEYYVSLQRKILFDNEKNNLIKELTKQNIKVLPLKGVITNNLYPSKNIRKFADLDLLLEKKDVPLANKILLDLGYQVEEIKDGEDSKEMINIYQDSAIHFSYYKSFFNIELHWALFLERLNFKYFDNFFKKAIKDTQNEYLYHMTNEDFYVYTIGHFYKHHIKSGVGIRQYLDIYYIRKGLKIDYQKVDKILEELGLTAFHLQTLELIDVLFSSKEMPSKEDLHFIFSGSAHGNKENKINSEIKRMGKLNYIMYRVLPPYKRMCQRYRILKKAPYLLPLFYIIRGVEIVLNNNEDSNLRFEYKMMKNYEKEHK